MIQIPFSFQEATKILLKDLPTRRMRDVIERRFGLKGGRRHTLEAIGKEYKITRERVRQIETDALRNLGQSGALPVLEPVFQALENHLREHGAVMAEHHFLSSVAEAKIHPHVRLLLDVGTVFRKIPETDHCYPRWTVDLDAVARGDKVIVGVVRDLESLKKPVSESALYDIVARNAKAIEGTSLHRPVLAAYLAAHKYIRKNPYGEYGMSSWAAVNPRGVRDKAHVVLVKAGEPMHFREVAHAISEAGWSVPHFSPATPRAKSTLQLKGAGSKRRAHPQTVHNELIKDSRFVLVGRGLYALKEWGYEAGTVKDIIVSVLKQAHRTLTKDEIVSKVFEKRMVKAPTIFLNLQNKSLFRKTEEGKYTLV